MAMVCSFSLEFVGEDHAGCDASATSNQSMVATEQITASNVCMRFGQVCEIAVAPRTVETHAYPERAR